MSEPFYQITTDSDKTEHQYSKIVYGEDDEEALKHGEQLAEQWEGYTITVTEIDKDLDLSDLVGID